MQVRSHEAIIIMSMLDHQVLFVQEILLLKRRICVGYLFGLISGGFAAAVVAVCMIDVCI